MKKTLRDNRVIPPDVPCPYCTGNSRYRLSSHDVNRKTTAEKFDFYQCGSCDLMFLSPLPADLRPFYRGGYQPIPKDLAGLKNMAKAERFRMEPILRHKSRGSLLEIGPWIGIFSCNAKDAGFDVTAIEIDVGCVDFLKNVAGIEAIQSDDPAAAMKTLGKQFDVIALWHSLEHLRDPWLVLQAAAEHLAPEGILLIAVPNIESYDFAVLKEGWRHLDAPRHLYFYSARGLVNLCQSYGLKPLEIDTADRLGKILSRDAWHVRARRIFPLKYVRWVLGSILYLIASRKSPHRTSGLTAIFTK